MAFGIEFKLASTVLLLLSNDESLRFNFMLEPIRAPLL